MRIALGLMLALCLWGQPSQYDFVSPAPPSVPPSSVTTAVVGVAGVSTYYYWIVANYQIGSSLPSGPASVLTANGTLSPLNYVQVRWRAMPSALTYDLLRTTTETRPSGACGCAVATAIVGTVQNDTSNALGAYVVTAVATAYGYIRLNNRDYTTPELEIVPFPTVGFGSGLLPYLGALSTVGAIPRVTGSMILGQSNLRSVGDDLLFAVDGVGNIGAIAGNRPANIFAHDAIVARTYMQVGGTYQLIWEGRTWLYSSADGYLTPQTTAGGDFYCLQMGGTTNAYGALCRDGAGVSARASSNDAYTTIRAASVRAQTGANIASAATMTLLDDGDTFHITGTTNVTTVNTCNATYSGRRVTLIFNGILTFTDGLNLKLAGNFVTTADDTISLVCDGTNWYETGRSVN